jgi:hypothetical protein
VHNPSPPGRENTSKLFFPNGLAACPAISQRAWASACRSRAAYSPIHVSSLILQLVT